MHTLVPLRGPSCNVCETADALSKGNVRLVIRGNGIRISVAIFISYSLPHAAHCPPHTTSIPMHRVLHARSATLIVLLGLCGTTGCDIYTSCPSSLFTVLYKQQSSLTPTSQLPPPHLSTPRPSLTQRPCFSVPPFFFFFFLQVMIDPVFTCDGHTFERMQIEKWLTANETSPLTGMKLDSRTLVPNVALRNSIDEYFGGHATEIAATLAMKEIELEREIGASATKTVFEARWRGKRVAALKMKADACKTEAAVLTRLSKHPSLIRVFGIANDGSSGYDFLVTEYAPLGSLCNVLERFVEQGTFECAHHVAQRATSQKDNDSVRRASGDCVHMYSTAQHSTAVFFFFLCRLLFCVCFLASQMVVLHCYDVT